MSAHHRLDELEDEYLRRRENSIKMGKQGSTGRTATNTKQSPRPKPVSPCSVDTRAREMNQSSLMNMATAVKTGNSPLALKIRQQILKPYEGRDDNSNSTYSTANSTSASTTNSTYAERRRRLMQQRVKDSRKQQQQQQWNRQDQQPAPSSETRTEFRGESSSNRTVPVTPSPRKNANCSRISEMRDSARKSRMALKTSNASNPITTPYASKAVSVLIDRTRNSETPPLAPKADQQQQRRVTPPEKQQLSPASSHASIIRNRLNKQPRRVHTSRHLNPETPLQQQASPQQASPMSQIPKSQSRWDQKPQGMYALNKSKAETTKLKQGVTTAPLPSKAEDDDFTLKVYVRKRPIFAKQVQNGDCDVVRVFEEGVVVYRTTMSEDGTTKMVQPVVFAGHLAGAFDQDATSEEVYQKAVRPLVESVVYEQKAATLLMFGQSQSGKTYTLQACQKFVSADLFKLKQQQVRVQCLELIGNRCKDLLGEGNENVKIVDDENGPSVTLVNALTTVVDSPRDLLSILVRTQKRRDKKRHSHAIYQMRTVGGGVLTLLDCASMERRDEGCDSAEINASLYALKECIRVRGLQKQLRVPYRSSNLTRVLRESLEGPEAHLAVIANVAPHSAVTEQTIQTLKTLAHITGAPWQERSSQKAKSSATSSLDDYEGPLKSPKKWDHQELIAWLKDRRLLGSSPVPKRIDGRTVMRMSRIQLRNTFYDNDQDKSWAVEKADLLFKSLRVESDRISRIELKRRLEAVKQNASTC